MPAAALNDVEDAPARERAPRALARGLTVLSAVALLSAAQALWAAAAAAPLTATGHAVPPAVLHGALVLLAVLVFAVLLAAASAALGAGRRLLSGIDGVLLGSAVLLALGRFALEHAPNDEGALTDRAATALLAGQPVYGASWPSVFVTQPLTKTMSGGGDTTYGYPPLGVLLTAAVHRVLGHTAVAAPAVAMGAFLVLAVALWLAVPRPWRPVVTTAVLAIDGLAAFARGGSPILLALVLLLPVLLRLHTLGAGGRLGAPGAARAACLGAACAAHQLPWFLLPFLLVVLLGMRTRELGLRSAVLVIGRLLAAAAAVWLAVDLPFALRQPAAWWHGMLLPLDQHAIVHGQGIVDVPYLVTSGSGALDLLSDATLALLCALVLATWLLPRRFGPAVAVLPVAVFLVATRGSYDYWIQFAPLWVAVAATVPLAAFRRAAAPAVVARLPRPAAAALLALAAVPAVVLATVALSAPPPLLMSVTALLHAPRTTDRIAGIEVTVADRSDRAVSPHFAWRPSGSASDWWGIVSGPRTLRPGERARYLLVPGSKPLELVPDSVLLAVSDRPMTITNATVPDRFTRDAPAGWQAWARPAAFTASAPR